MLIHQKQQAELNMPQFVFVQHQTIIDATKRVKKSGHSTIGRSLILILFASNLVKNLTSLESS